MRIVCIGGGPAGLYFALLMKKQCPQHHVTVVERNRPFDTFGWGVVFSDATMESMRRWDPETAATIEDAFNHWDDIELVFKGRKIRTTGHGFVGIGRKRMLNILQERCLELGVELVFEREVQGDDEFPEADLIISSDGVNSRIRAKYADVFKPDMLMRPNRYIWLGTDKCFDAFTFDFRRTQHGWFQAHIYRFDQNTSTFIVETTDEVFRAHGIDRMDQEESIAFCEALFAETLGGHRLLSNARHLRGSAWLNFGRLVCEKWSHYNGRSHVVLMGDSAHTAHFAIGSGTKLAIDDAIELTNQFNLIGHETEKIPAVLEAYEAARRVDVARIQNAARNAMEWFEVVGQRYADTLEPEQFMYSMLTRSQRISHENLRLRDPVWLEGYERWFAERAGAPPQPDGRPVPPMFTPIRSAA
jgi:anthraniloyl-CoA monooxygenase